MDILVPRRGEKAALVQTAMENAREALQMMRARWLADSGKTQQALAELQEELNLPKLPQRIECYDISNIMGTSAVGSMVVFVDGHPHPAEYRRALVTEFVERLADKPGGEAIINFSEVMEAFAAERRPSERPRPVIENPPQSTLRQDSNAPQRKRPPSPFDQGDD